MRDPNRPADPFALEMLDPAEQPAVFWFTRVLLVQAVARRCIGRDDCAAGRELVFATRDDAHPFVRATARLCAARTARGGSGSPTSGST